MFNISENDFAKIICNTIFLLLSSRFDDVTMSNFGWTAFFFDKEDFSFYAKLCLMANIEFLQKKMKGKYVTSRTFLYKGIFFCK